MRNRNCVSVAVCMLGPGDTHDVIQLLHLDVPVGGSLIIGKGVSGLPRLTGELGQSVFLGLIEVPDDLRIHRGPGTGGLTKYRQADAG